MADSRCPCWCHTSDPAWHQDRKCPCVMTPEELSEFPEPIILTDDEWEAWQAALSSDAAVIEDRPIVPNSSEEENG